MSRFALLIDASNVKGLDDLPGARRDIQNWKDYLSSRLGGSWVYSRYEAQSHIVIRNKPSILEVQRLLEANRGKYCFVAFAGHGFHDPRYGDFVCLNDDDQECRLSEIKPKSTRGTLVADACRGYEKAHTATTLELSAERRAHLVIANSARQSLLEKKADQHLSFSAPGFHEFERTLEKSPNGIVTMLSCAKGESADDIRVEGEEIGGIYTTLLMRAAEIWEDRIIGTSVFSTREAHDSAAAYMKENFPQQHPEYSPLHLRFPFAVK